MKTLISALYDDILAAYFVVLNLRQHVFDSEDISLIMQDLRQQPESVAAANFVTKLKMPQWVNYDVLLGSLKGQLSNTVSTKYYGMSPIIEAGPIVGLVRTNRDFTDSLVAALTRLGISDDEGEILAE